MRLSEMVREASYPCPHCGAGNRGALHLLIDAQSEPELAADLAAGRLNQLVCAACATVYAPDVPLLYWDSTRRLAAAQVPAALDDAETAVNALLSAWLHEHPDTELDDHLLMPEVARSAADLRDIIASGDGGEGFDLDILLSYAIQHDAEPVMELLDLLAGVDDEEAFIATVNAHPALLTPQRYQAVIELSQAAEADGLLDVAEVFADLASLLELHRPADEDEDDLETSDALTSAERELLIAGDLEAAKDHLEAPDPRRMDDARRALQTVEKVDADWREGFIEHARLFGTLVDDMMQPDTPNVLPDTEAWPDLPAAPPGVGEESWAALLAAPTPDLADDVITAHPDLLVPAVVDTLADAITTVENIALEAWAAHLNMLRQAVLLATDDDED